MEKIEEIFQHLRKELITVEEAQRQVEDLFAASDRSEQLTAFAEWLEDNYSIKIHDMILQDYIRYGG
jgi:hypothetical protein